MSETIAATDLRICTRGFDGAGALRCAGEVVNIASPAWKNAGELELLRYLRPLPEAVAPPNVTLARCAKCDRSFIDQVSRSAHACQGNG